MTKPRHNGTGDRPYRVNILELRCVVGTGGGPDKTVLLSARHADASRFNVTVAYIHNAHDPRYTIAQRARSLGLTFHDLPERFYLDPFMLTNLAAIIARASIDIVHVHDYKSTLFGLMLRPFFRFKLISTVHGWGVQSPKLALYYRAERLGLCHFDRVIYVSRDLQDMLLSSGVSSERLVYLPNGIDTEEFHRNSGRPSLRDELRLDPKQILVGAVGRLSPEKDFITFLQVAKRIALEIPDVRFVIVGEGDERQRLEQTAAELDLRDRVFFLGHRSDIISIYSSLDLFLLTSVREGLPNVVLEAMAMEVPVIATQVAGVADLIHNGAHGRVFQPGDVRGIAAAAVAMLRDSAGTARIVEAARMRVCRDFSFRERVRKLENIYCEMMQDVTQ